MLYATCEYPPIKKPAMIRGSGKLSGASGTANEVTGNISAGRTIAGPTPIDRCTRFAASAPATEPTPNMANVKPTATDERWRTRTK